MEPRRATHPDGSFDQIEYEKLDTSRTKDGRGRWTTMLTDALRRTSAVRDPLGRTVAFD